MQASDNVFNFHKWVAIFGIFLIAVFGLFGIFALVMQSDWGRQKMVFVLTEAMQDSGWSADVEEISGSLAHEITLHGVRLQSSSQDVVTIQSIQAELSLIQLLKKEVTFTKFHADKIEWTPGVEFQKNDTPQETKEAGIPFIIHFTDLRLTNVHIPNWQKPIDISGEFKIGRHNRRVYAKLFAQMNENRASVTLRIRPNKLTQIKLDVSIPASTELTFFTLPLQATGDLHFYAKGPWESFSSLIVNNQTHATIKGIVNGSIQVQNMDAPESINHLIAGSWKLSSAFERTPNQEIRFFNSSAVSQAIQSKGDFILQSNGQLKELSWDATVSDLSIAQIPTLKGSLTAQLKLLENTHATLIVGSPQLFWKNQSAQKFYFSLQAERENENWSANLDMTANVLQNEWNGKCNFYWAVGQRLKITDLSLTSALANVKGAVEILPQNLLIGEFRTQINNLHNFEIPLYGAVDATIRLKVDETQKKIEQLAEIDAKTNEFYYNHLQIEKAYVYANLNGSIEKIAGHAYIELQQTQYKNIYVETAAIETTSTDNNWPFSFKAEGDWREPFVIAMNGFWFNQDSHFSIHLQDLSGTLFSRPLNLTAPSEFEIAPQTIVLKDFAITIGDSLLQASLYHQNNQTEGQIKLTSAPLDFLSLNPLNLSVNGLVDLDAQILEKNGAAEGKLLIKLSDVQIADISASEPIRAEGQVAVELAKKRMTCDADLTVNQKPLLHLSADLPIKVGIYPWHSEFLLNPSAKAHLSLNGQIEDLLDFFNLGAHRIEGDCKINLTISNNLANPTIQGFCRVENGRYENYYSGFELQNISVDIFGERQSLILRSLSGQDSQKKGRISLKGHLLALLKERLPYRLEGEFSRLNVAEIDWMRAEAGGTVEIFGDLDAAHIKAQTVLLESDLSIPERIPSQLPNLQVKYINAPKPIAVEKAELTDAKPYPIFLNLHIYAPEGIFVSGRGLNSEWKGNFQLGGTYTDIEAKGQLELMSGEFLFSGRAFKLTEGSISFSGKPHEMPWINLAGQMRLQDIDILARLKGPLTSPQLAFQSIPPLPVGSILSHLLFGQDLSDINVLQAAQIVNTLATFSPASPNILNTTRRALGIDRLRIVATPTGDEGAESISLQVGKYVTRGILVSVSQGFEAGSTNLSVEVDLANGFVFQAESQQEQEQGKFTIKWNLNY